MMYVNGDPISTWLQFLYVCIVWKYVLCVVCAYVCALCIWFFVCAMRALVGFRGVGWPVRWRQLSEGAGQSALRK